MNRVDPVPSYTLEDYDVIDRGPRGERFEFIGSEIIAMVGGNLEHHQIISNLQLALAPYVQPPCRVLRETFRLHVHSADDESIFYPDVLVTCQSLTHQATAATDATLIIEVASDSTRQYDAKTKLERYKQLPSLREIVLVETSEPRVNVHRIREKVTDSYTQLDQRILLASVESWLPRVKDIYAGIEFTAT